MELSVPLAMLALGLVSSAHCAGMCGGVVGAFSARVTVFPKNVLWQRQLVFNAGRISTYGLAGALAGAAGGLGGYAAGALPIQGVLYALANVVLIVMGLHLAGLGGWMAWIENLGRPLWRSLQPVAARLLPSKNLPGVFAAGLVWGWLPCGLVYGALAVAAFAGDAGRGAAAMLAFGLGTLPALLAMGAAAARVRAFMGRRAVRGAAGAAVLGFGAYGLAHAEGIADGIRRGILCL